MTASTHEILENAQKYYKDKETPGRVAIFALDPHFEYDETQSFEINFQNAFDTLVTRLHQQKARLTEDEIAIIVLERLGATDHTPGKAHTAVFSQSPRQLLMNAYRHQEKRAKRLEKIADILMFTGFILATAGFLSVATGNPAALPLLAIAATVLTISLALLLIVNKMTQKNLKRLQPNTSPAIQVMPSAPGGPVIVEKSKPKFCCNLLSFFKRKPHTEQLEQGIELRSFPPAQA